MIDCWLKQAHPKHSNYYLTDAEPASPVKPARVVTSNFMFLAGILAGLGSMLYMVVTLPVKHAFVFLIHKSVLHLRDLNKCHSQIRLRMRIVKFAVIIPK